MNNSINLETFSSTFIALQFNDFLNRVIDKNNIDWSINDAAEFVERIKELNDLLENYINQEDEYSKLHVTRHGKYLNEIGGIPLMVFVVNNLVKIKRFPHAEEELSNLWNNIGGWNSNQRDIHGAL